MKRTEILSIAKHMGYIGNMDGLTNLLIGKNGKKVGITAVKKAYTAGKRLKELDLPCDCTECNEKRGGKA